MILLSVLRYVMIYQDHSSVFGDEIHGWITDWEAAPGLLIMIVIIREFVASCSSFFTFFRLFISS